MKAQKPLIFVTGKGGVGKSTFASSLALGLSQAGKKVLLVEFSENSFYEKFFQLPKVGFLPVKVKENLDVAAWDYISCLREYVGFYVKIDKIFDLFFSNQVVQKFIQAAPTLKELALLGKATSGPRHIGPPLNYDHIIFDSYSTGHHKALLKAPFGMSEVIQKGPMGTHSRNMILTLQNPVYTHHYIILKPEEMPVVEGEELQKNLKNEFGLESECVMNQVVDYPKEAQHDSSNSLQHYFYSDYEQQRKYLKENQIQTRFYFEKKDKFHFLNSIYTDFMRSQN